MGFLRCNVIVHVPTTTSVEQFRELLTVLAAKFASKRQWKKWESSRDLFDQGQKALLALSSVQFDPVQYEVRIATKYGNVPVAQNPYEAGPSFATCKVGGWLRHETIESIDQQSKMIGSLPGILRCRPETISEPSMAVGGVGAQAWRVVKFAATRPVRRAAQGLDRYRRYGGPAAVLFRTGCSRAAGRGRC